MSVTITALSNTDTFGTWKGKTNELITVAGKAVTMGDANAGNIALNGDITLESGHTITVDNITKASGSTINLLNPTEITGDLTLDSGASAVKLQFDRDGTNKYAIETSASHDHLQIKDEATGNYLRISGTAITTSGLIIADAALPAVITKRITHNGTDVSTASTFGTVDIGGGTGSEIDNTIIGVNAPAEAAFNKVTINGGTSSVINNTDIGTTTPKAGTFTSIATSSNGHITLNGTGQLRGDVAKADGTTIVDVSEAEFKGDATGLTATGITDVLKAVYPIGSLYVSTADVNPETARSASDNTGGLGFGTWVRYAEGRTLVGLDTGVSINSGTADGTAGTATFDISGAETDRFSVGEIVAFTNVGGAPSGSGITDNIGHEVVPTVPANSQKVTVKLLGGSPTSGSYSSLGTATVRRKHCDAIDEKGGDSFTTLTEPQMPAHDHKIDPTALFSADNNPQNTNPTRIVGDVTTPDGDFGMNEHVGTGTMLTEQYLETRGESKGHSNLNPFVTVTIWKRTA